MTSDESVYRTIIWNGRDCGAREMNQPHRKPIFIQRR